MTDYALGIAHDERTASMFAFVSADTFAGFYFAARTGSDLIREATSPFDYDADPGTTYRLTSDGRSGYAVRNDGELVYVFSTLPRRGVLIVNDAVRMGALYLDCFEGYLPGLYATAGFKIDSFEDNWIPGGPRVAHMSRPGHSW